MRIMRLISRIVVLTWADSFSGYVLWMLMIYLTDVWKLGYTHAAAIINIWTGSALVLPILSHHLADAFLGNFCPILLSTLSYAAGPALLWMSTPPVLAKTYGNCPAYKPECIGDHQKVLFYTGLALIAVGKSGNRTFLGPFTHDQAGVAGNANSNEEDEICFTASCFCLGVTISALMPIAAILVVVFVKSWATQFEICTIITMVSTIIFLSGVCSYKYARPVGSTMTTIFRVFFASFSKMMRRTPQNDNDLYQGRALRGDYRLSRTKCLRCLDKAAIVLPHQPVEQQERNRWRLCSVTEVEETKFIISMIPLWLTMVLLGVVSSFGNTYFLEQAKNLNPKDGHLKVPLIILLWFYDQGKKFFSNYFVKIFMCFASTDDDPEEVEAYVPIPGFLVAMFFSILCCITAASVETRRLGVVKAHGLVDKPDAMIPLSIFWLLPQFALLGAMDGILNISYSCLYSSVILPSVGKYVRLFTEGAFGAGIMGSALSVYILGKINQQGGENTGWLQSTLNRSHLDNYYWALAALCAINLVVFVMLAICYCYKYVRVTNSNGSADDDCLWEANCCCC